MHQIYIRKSGFGNWTNKIGFIENKLKEAPKLQRP
jgi:hypothetical protein